MGACSAKAFLKDSSEISIKLLFLPFLVSDLFFFLFSAAALFPAAAAEEVVSLLEAFSLFLSGAPALLVPDSVPEGLNFLRAGAFPDFGSFSVFRFF